METSVNPLPSIDRCSLVKLTSGSIFSCRLEQRLATRRARLAELRQQMEVERGNHPQNDPEAMKALARVQVSSLFPSLYSSCAVFLITPYSSFLVTICLVFILSDQKLIRGCSTPYEFLVRLKRNIHKFPMNKKRKIIL